MDLGSLEVQIFVSLVVVLGSAFIALVCDFLKGNNEQLRERNVELRTRQDEREKLGFGQPMAWLQGLAALIQRGPAPAAATPAQPEATARKESPSAPEPARPAAPEATPVSWTPPEPTPSVSESAPEPPMRRRLYDEAKPAATTATWASKEELEQLAGRAARIRARHEAGQQSPEPTEHRPAPAPEPAAPETREPVPPGNGRIHILPLVFPPEAAQSTALVQPEPAEAETVQEPDPIAATEPVEDELAETQPEPATEFEPAMASEPPVPEPEPLVEESDTEPQPEASEVSQPPETQKAPLPGGVQESAVLSRLLEVNDTFNGVAVSIGINDFEALRERLASAGDAGEAMTPVQKLIDSMLRPEDFACQFTDDEFVLLFPGESGSAAQRRLFQVSEKLWDFQLRSLGQLAVMFSWGGLEVPNDSLSSAVAAARERMYQTRRNRRQSPLDRMRVVNG